MLVCRRWELEQRSLHGTSLGPGLLSWSHIKEQPCLSTCAGWSPFAFPSVGKVSHIRTYTKYKDRCSGDREDEEKAERMHLSLKPQSNEHPPIRVKARLTAMEHDNQRNQSRLPVAWAINLRHKSKATHSPSHTSSLMCCD